MVAPGSAGLAALHLNDGEPVLFPGGGPVGLMVWAASALRGAGRIIAVGSRPKTLELAERFGASNLVDYKKGDVLAQVMELTGGEPVDGVLIASGGAPDRIFTTAMRAVKFGGNVACVSLFFDEESVTLPLDVWMQGGMEKRLTGVLCNDGRDFFERLLALIRFKRLDPAPLATHVLHGWQRLEDGLRLMASRDPSVLKAVVVP